MTLPQELAGLSQAFDGAEIDLYGRAELQAQLEANLAAQGKQLPQAPVDALADIATKAVAEVVGANWEVATSAHREVERLFGEMLPSLKVPELSAFIEAGVDFVGLKAGFEAYQTAGLKPELILAPVNLSLEDAKQLYSNLRAWQETQAPLPPDGQSDPLEGRRLKVLGDSYGLYVNEDVADAWRGLATDATIGTPGHMTSSLGGSIWKVLVVPTADKAEGGLATNTDHNLTATSDSFAIQAKLQNLDPSSITPDSAHMPIASYLTLQAMRIRRDIQAIDHGVSTWQAGAYSASGGLQAPVARWYTGDGQVSVFQGEVGDVSGYRGARLPVWG